MYSAKDIHNTVVKGLCVLLTSYQFLVAYSPLFPPIVHRAIFLGSILVITFLVYPTFTKKTPETKWNLIVGIILSIIGAISMSYIIYNEEVITIIRVSEPILMDVILGVITIFLVLEATRRTLGIWMVIFIGIMITYTFFGRYMPDLLAHKGYDLVEVVGHLYLSLDGILGIGVAIGSSFLYTFILFGSLMMKSGTGEGITDLIISLFGKRQAGGAKAATVASGLVGSISGSAIANVVITGSFTIPMMKKEGLEPSFAGGVEAVASTGGYIFPPVMGAVAFLMAEILQIPYREIVIAAIVPGFLYYLGIYFSIHFYARRKALPASSMEKKSSFKNVLKTRGHLFFPFIILVYMIMAGYSPDYSAFFSCVALIAISYIRKDTRMTIRKLAEAFIDAAQTALPLGATMAVVGMLVGLFNMTGVGLRISGVIVDLSGGNLFFLAIIAAGVSIALGMGMPSIPVYILVSTTAVPAMVAMGVDSLVSHFFVFYYGTLANITPPVCVAAYAAAIIANANPMDTGWKAVKIGLSAFILPIVFFYQPALLLVGDFSSFIFLKTIGSTILAIIAFSASIQGYLFKRLNWIERVFLAVAALLLFMVDSKAEMIGLTLFIGVALEGWIFKRRGKVLLL